MKTLEIKESAIADFFEPHLGLHIEQTTSPIFNEKGEVVASTHITRDITQRKLAEEERLSHQKVVQELALAGRIQASFLPSDTPYVPEWQLAATLVPTKETAGDFYDYIPLPNGKLGILIADVTDKGMAAALYMALTRTLIRTYAVEYDEQPELAFSAANRRILTDTHSDLFVTVFYGIIDPVTGILTYCNAGHNPPYLLHAQNGDAVQALHRTGIPLGVYEDETWSQGIVQLIPGDTLVLYTDGITEAQNRQEKFFGKGRLLEVTQANLGRSAQEIQDALLTAVDKFVGTAPQFDDITLMVVVRGLPK
jgi:sigma-B regulation protein RsbU (phosphoserine phosphatase)